MFLIITRDMMFFTAMKSILNKGNVVHIQTEEEIDLTLHQNSLVIIDTLMNNVFHSTLLNKIKRLNPVHVIIFSPFNIKRCLGKIPVTFVQRAITIIDFIALINGSYCSAPEADVSLSCKQHQVLTCIANQMTTEDILEQLKISLKTFYCHKHNIMMILNLKRINELVRHQHIDYLV
ncbi:MULTISPECIES: helix-turn-helix transcriptional regulator [Escherichia]|uniref:Helix-turn-helix transcriptional regulator n=1 Tax=Escherichia whittamii TaxID=2762229 RepID=A0ABR8TF14_9ESCH|nr:MULTISPECIES: LuxR C-terminal-related transcriptional regulator [Escherichia]QLX46681.1 helix-turn-helix transcriptional regulator [Escherichia coli]MBD7974365.1 helix-turn-helix transcriptional regulator [Escherichia whittamii]MCA4893198.1 LuxR C-terminal-related transcriptional regulator [Escherichia whittamii]MEC9497764.1 LuxR C-terminal-related transcriptional regulator [Escherichia whittamii]MEC9562052.1 LuxR C-terminal-related transcriptional regulator [Escherichia whittamii]